MKFPGILNHTSAGYFVVCLSFCIPATAQVNSLTPAEEAAGWILLFDGQDKDTHWRSGENGTVNNWTVEDSAMKSPVNGDMVFTRESYDNFEYSLEWRLNEGGNSGIFWRVVDPPGWFCSGPEYAILDEVNGGDRTAMGYIGDETEMPIKVTASCYDIYVTKVDGVVDSPFVNHAKPYDQWNQGVVWADGLHIEHWLNGYKVVDYIIGSDEWNERFGYSKFSRQCSGTARDNYGKHPSGLLGMQGHGNNLLVWFRSMKVRPFTPGEKLVSPLVAPEAGTYDDSVVVSLEVAISGATIYYTTEESDPTVNSTVYNGPFTLNETKTVKAVTYRNDFQISDPVSAEYVVNSTSTRAGIPRNPAWHMEDRNGIRRLVFSGLREDKVKIEITDIRGIVAASALLDRKNSTMLFPGAKQGIYFVKMTHPDFFLCRKMLIR